MSFRAWEKVNLVDKQIPRYLYAFTLDIRLTIKPFFIPFNVTSISKYNNIRLVQIDDQS